MASDVQHSAERADTTPVDGLLAAAREVLGMELAYLAELEDAQLVLREIDGDTTAYGGVAPGFTFPREYSWCHAMVAGDAAQLVKDAADSAEAADHPFVKATGIRAYAGTQFCPDTVAALERVLDRGGAPRPCRGRTACRRGA